MATTVKNSILDALDGMDISYECFPHPPITTMEEGRDIAERIGIMPCKNLFLVNKQGQHFLLVMQGDKRFSAKDVARQIGGSHLSFASAEDMETLLHAGRGAASILGVVFDEGQQVQVLIDKDVLDCEFIACHPCENTCTLKLHTADVVNIFLSATKHGYLKVDIP